MQHQIELLERSVREKSVEAKQLQKQNAELERARHTEVVKLRLEVGMYGIYAICEMYQINNRVVTDIQYAV